MNHIVVGSGKLMKQKKWLSKELQNRIWTKAMKSDEPFI